MSDEYDFTRGRQVAQILAGEYDFSEPENAYASELHHYLWFFEPPRRRQTKQQKQRSIQGYNGAIGRAAHLLRETGMVVERNEQLLDRLVPPKRSAFDEYLESESEENPTTAPALLRRWGF